MGQFTNREFRSLFIKKNIKHKKIVAYSPQQNGSQKNLADTFLNGKVSVNKRKITKEIVDVCNYGFYIYMQIGVTI